MGYKFYYSSQIGTSHIKTNTPKQDDLGILNCVINDKEYLISAVADGAGSAKYSQISSKHICKFLIKKMQNWLKENELANFSKEIVISWIKEFQNILNRFIRVNKLSTIRDFATTILFAILSDSKNIFFQIGDGAIVVGNSEKLECVFLPQKGEYANTTHFIVEQNFENNLAFKVFDESFERVAMHTDGIENISLIKLETPHLGFFNPFFDCLADEPLGYNKDVSEELGEFLSSNDVNQRTDDDKTMVVIVKA